MLDNLCMTLHNTISPAIEFLKKPQVKRALLITTSVVGFVALTAVGSFYGGVVGGGAALVGVVVFTANPIVGAISVPFLVAGTGALIAPVFAGQFFLTRFICKLGLGE